MTDLITSPPNTPTKPRSKNAEYNQKYRAAHPDRVRDSWKKHHEANREKIREEQRAYRETNREKVRENARKHAAANKEKIQAKSREYRKANPGKRAAANRKYASANPEKEAERKRQWNKANREKQQATNQRRRANKLAAEGSYTGADVKRQYKAQRGHCYYCNVEVKKYEVDHIVPLSRGGSNSPENLVIACRPCNRSKSDKMLHEWDGSNKLL